MPRTHASFYPLTHASGMAFPWFPTNLFTVKPVTKPRFAHDVETSTSARNPWTLPSPATVGPTAMVGSSHNGRSFFPKLDEFVYLDDVVVEHSLSLCSGEGEAARRNEGKTRATRQPQPRGPVSGFFFRGRRGLVAEAAKEIGK